MAIRLRASDLKLRPTPPAESVANGETERAHRPSMSGHDLQTSCSIGGAPRQRTHFDSDRSKRSRRTVEAARVNAKAYISHAGGKPFTDDFRGLNRDRRRKQAREERVQRAAVIGAVSARIAVMACASWAILVMGVLMKTPSPTAPVLIPPLTLARKSVV
jgi:hypothetical protein